MESHKEEFFNTFTMALAIMNCHGYKPMDPPLLISRQEKDILMLDYLGLKFKVSELNANKITSLLSHFFMRSYNLDVGHEYDALPVYKAVEAISSEFKTRTNKLIKPSTPQGEKLVEDSVLIGERALACPIAKGFARTAHEQFRAMKNELVSCKLLPYKIVKRGVFAPSSSKIIQDTRPLFHSKSFKIVKNLYDKHYSLSQDDLILGHYIMFKKIQVEISGNKIRFIELESNTAPFQFEEGNVRISKSDIIRELSETFPDCDLNTLTDLTCNSCYDEPDYEELYGVPRQECPGSEPGEGGGSRRKRTAHRKRKSHRKSKRVHHTRKKHTRRHRHSRHSRHHRR